MRDILVSSGRRVFAFSIAALAIGLPIFSLLLSERVDPPIAAALAVASVISAARRFE